MHEQTKLCVFDNIDLDLRAVEWIDADMCAALGAIMYRSGEDLNTVKLEQLQDNVKTILSKNGFLSFYGGEKIPDRWGTTIPYQRFDVKDDRFFGGYIENELINRSELPTMSTGLLKKFSESIFEIFSNAVIHSRTQHGIFSCGQFFPKRNRIDFSVADLGVGIRQTIKENIGLDLAPHDAIDWATTGRNTTKRGKIPGGLGLKLLVEFIDLNGGCIQIVSDAGYWRREHGKTITSQLRYNFPGTVVSVEINTADTNEYVLRSELTGEKIF